MPSDAIHPTVVEPCEDCAETRVIGRFKAERGAPLPYGVTELHQGINFALFSEHSSAAWLVIFPSEGDAPLAEIELDPGYNRTGFVWHVLVRNVDPTLRYGWRLDGPMEPREGHRYDRDKVLIDPYAKALSGGSRWGESDIVHMPGSDGEQVVCNRLGRIAPQLFDWEGDHPPRIPMEEVVVYELHVRGYTIRESAAVEAPGTYLGLAEKIPYLQDLGINAVELMPVFEFDENEHLRHHPGTGQILRNYWGYSPIAFFAPKASYAKNGHEGAQVDEFREMVKRFHKAGIEVYLDVVFNHTGEGDDRGPTVSFRGIDNSIYYMLDEKGGYRNYSGCGNTFNCNHPHVRATIIDCLRYWVAEMHVDGFRFDLASILGRGEGGEVLKNPPLLERIAVDPVLADTKIIAEAWDAAGLYQVGTFPSWGRWCEWNGIYRDHVRNFWNAAGGVGDLAARLCGSEDIYKGSGRRPSHSINFITAHDGFTLHDLVSYESKHNEDNGEENRDGENHNLSMNFGVEGETGDGEINRLRKKQMKNLLATLFLSQGTPMLLGGDEFARTQRGNNNAYCQDSEISWVDWDLADRHEDLLRFTKHLIAFRRRHAALRRKDFFHGGPGINWHGRKLGEPDWSEGSKSIAFHLEGHRAPEGDREIYVMLNANTDWASFAVPDVGKEWLRAIDTERPSPHDIVENDDHGEVVGYHHEKYRIAPRSLVVLVSR